MARLLRDLNREQIWRRHLDQQRSSGLTVRAYCQEHALRETSFFFWKKEIAKRDSESRAIPSATTAPSAPAFVPVAVIDSPADRNETTIDVRLAGGHRVRVRSGCDRGLLADVLTLLARPASGGPPC
jgi:transposase